MFDRGLFDAARKAVSVEALAGREVALFRSGGEMRGLCPLCCMRGKSAAPVRPKVEGETGGRKRKGSRHRSLPFAVYGHRWTCHRCQEGGDVVDLEQALRGGSPVEAARRLAGNAPLPATVTPKAAPATAAKPAQPGATDRIAAELWRGAVPASGTLVETYLTARGIHAEVIVHARRQLRFHAKAKWWFDEEKRRWVHAPAMLALIVVQGDDGAPVATGGVHATYLADDGSGKASDDGDSKIMWGPQKRDGRSGGTWLIGPAGTGPAFGGEGIETSLSLASLHFLRTGQMPRAWAALSLDRLQGGIAKDEQKRIDAYHPQPDPQRTPFVWRGVSEVVIGLDRDMGDLTLKGRTPRGKTCLFTLDAEARARLCGRLAVAGWKAAGASARAVAPPPDSDFNDELRRVLARRERATA